MRSSKHEYTEQIFTSLFFNLLYAFHHDSQFHHSNSNFQQCTIVNTSHGVHNIIEPFREYRYKSKSKICNAQTCQFFGGQKNEGKTQNSTKHKFVIYNMIFQLLLPNHPNDNRVSNIARFCQLLD